LRAAIAAPLGSTADTQLQAFYRAEAQAGTKQLGIGDGAFFFQLAGKGDKLPGADPA
jgi:hypothetical protein